MPLDSIPAPVLGLGIVLILSIVIEIGFQIGKRITREEGLAKHPLEASVTTAILSLLAFLLAFSFGVAGTRFAKTRSLSIKESNLVGTLYMRADLLQEADIPVAKKLINEYLKVRLNGIEKSTVSNMKPLREALDRSEEIQAELWTMAAKARMEDNNTAVNLYITALNELINNDLERQSTAFANRLPRPVWYSLGFLGVLSTTMLGLSSGLHGRRSRLATTALIVAFSSVTILVVDLDRPIKSLFHRDDPAAEKILRSMEE